MATKFIRNTQDIKEEPKEIRDFQVTQLSSSGEAEIRSFEPSKLHRKGEGDYRAVKAKYGSLAVTDTDRPHREPKDARFSLNPLLRDPLLIEAEEQRAIEDRIQKGVQDIAEKAHAEATRRGYDEGFQSGKKEAMLIFGKEGTARLAKFDSILKEVDSAKADIFKTNERFLIELVFQIAKRVVLKDIQTDKAYLTRLAAALIERLDLGDSITILLNPEDHESIAKIREGLSQQIADVKNVHIEVSPKIPRGGCQIETDWGVISASIDSQLAEIEKSLLAPDTEGPK